MFKVLTATDKAVESENVVAFMGIVIIIIIIKKATMHQTKFLYFFQLINCELIEAAVIQI